jgi:cell envelope opacity-associated protein A
LIPSKEASATRQQQNIDLKLSSDGPRYIEAKSLLTAEAKVETPSDIVTTDAVTADIEETEAVQLELEPSWQDYKIKSGDSLALVFKRAGLPAKAMYELINKEPKAKELTKIFPGRTLSFAIDDNNHLYTDSNRL